MSRTGFRCKDTCRSLFEETERLRQENSILEEELQEANAEIMSVQEEAFTNEEVLLQRIQFLGQELEAQEADSSETIAQLDCELRSVAVALDRVTVERDNLSDALMEAARWASANVHLPSLRWTLKEDYAS